MNVDAATLSERYIAMWNEPDAETRHAIIRSLFADDGANLTATLEPRGYSELRKRVDSAHDRWIVGEKCLFRSTGVAKGHHGVAMFRWEMVGGDGAVMSVGTEVFVLAPDGRIQTAYTFVED